MFVQVEIQEYEGKGYLCVHMKNKLAPGKNNNKAILQTTLLQIDLLLL